MPIKIGGSQTVAPTVEQSTAQRTTQRANPGGIRGNRASALGGIGSGIAQAVGAVSQQVREEEMKVKRYDALKKFGDFQLSVNERMADIQQNAPRDGTGLTDTTVETYNELQDDFINSISPEVREEFFARTIAMQSGLQQSAVNTEIEMRSTAAIGDFNEKVNTATIDFRRDPSPENAAVVQASLQEELDALPIDATRREELERQTTQVLTVARTSALLTEGIQYSTIDPGSADFSDVVIPAVISVESAGRADAVSNKGAAGIMQVMPGTAREVARELGDENFPYGGTDQEVREYLFDKETGVRYGSHYLRNQLRRFDGDLEAALIAYNGGPRRAENFLAAGRDYSVIPEETQNYVPKVLSQFGVPTSRNLASPPLSEEDILNVAQQGRLPPKLTQMLLDAQQGLSDEAEKQNLKVFGRELESVGLGVALGRISVEEGQRTIRRKAAGLPGMTDEQKRTLLSEANAGMLEAAAFEDEIQALKAEGVDVDEVPLSELTRLARLHSADAAKDAKARRQAMADRRTALLEDARQSIRAGDPNSGQVIEDLVAASVIERNDDEYTKLVDLNKKENSERFAIRSVTRSIASGRPLPPGDASREQIDVFNRSNIPALLRGDEQQRADAASNLVDAFAVNGRVTRSLGEALDTMTNSRDQELVRLGVQVVEGLRQANEPAFRRWANRGGSLGGELDVRSKMFRTLTDFGVDGVDIMRFMGDQLTSDERRKLENAGKTVDAEVSEITDDELFSELTSSFVGRVGSTAASIAETTVFQLSGTQPFARSGEQLIPVKYAPGARRGMREDFTTLYRTYRTRFADAAKAKDLALKTLGNRYGQFNGVLMKNPPHLMYERVGNGGHDYIDKQVKADLPVREGANFELYHTGPQERSFSAGFDEAPEYGVRFIASRESAEEMLADAETEREKKAAQLILSQIGEADSGEAFLPNWKPDVGAARALAAGEQFQPGGDELPLVPFADRLPRPSFLE